MDSADEEEGSDSNIETIDKSKPFAGAKPDGQEVSDDEEEDDDDGFVVEDDADGVAVDLPAQFSRQSHQDLSMHFKVVCTCSPHHASLVPLIVALFRPVIRAIGMSA